MTASTSKRTAAPAKTATKPPSPSSSLSVGFFRQFEAYLRAHPTLDDHIQVGWRALPAFARQENFLTPFIVFGGTSMLMAWGIYFDPDEKGVLPWTPQDWAVTMYKGVEKGLDIAVVEVLRWVAFIVMLPLRAFAAFLSAFCIAFFVLSPFMLAALVLVPLTAYCSFEIVFPFLPSTLLRLLDYLSLPLLFHFLTVYFSLSLFAP
ncbi:hypothetical protein JCM6882_004519 [Rhodosporidiobolus microsporus]